MRVGSDVEAICGKCGEARHVVVARAEGRIAKVECQQCGARHGYRPERPDAERPRRSGAGSRAKRSATTRKAPLVEADPDRPRRPFHTTETYRVGDRVVHARFGEGVVQSVRGPAKIQVHFESGERTLVHGRSAE